MKNHDATRKQYLAGESQCHIAKVLGVSRNTVTKYCECASVPWEHKRPKHISIIMTSDVVDFIQTCLSANQEKSLKAIPHNKA